LSFNESFRVFLLGETTEGNMTNYTEWGAHLRMGTVWVAVLTVAAIIAYIKALVASVGTSSVATGPAWAAYTALAAILLGVDFNNASCPGVQ